MNVCYECRQPVKRASCEILCPQGHCFTLHSLCSKAFRLRSFGKCLHAECPCSWLRIRVSRVYHPPNIRVECAAEVDEMLQRLARGWKAELGRFVAPRVLVQLVEEYVGQKTLATFAGPRPFRFISVRRVK